MDSSSYFTAPGSDVHESITSQPIETGSFTEDCSPVVPISTPPLAFPITEDLPIEERDIFAGFNRIIAAAKIQTIKPGQQSVFRALRARKDVLLIAPTGWGKSLLFNFFRLMLPEASRCITLIFVPLEGLGNEQVSRLNKSEGPTTAILFDGSKVERFWLDRIKAGQYKVVFISPEKAMKPEVHKILWDSPDFRHRVNLIAVDEAHLVVEWYVDFYLSCSFILFVPRGTGFRQTYGQLGRIRGKFGTEVPWLVTSATLPKAKQEETLASLRIPAALGIDEDLDRPNLYYNIMQSKIGIKYQGKTPTPLDFIVTDHQNSSEEIPKTLVYFDSKEALRHFRDRLRSLLPSHWTADQRKVCIEAYYADRSSQDKARVAEMLRVGTCRVVLCTEAFGMGMDVPDIAQVYNWGPPRTIASLIQRFGRGARAPNTSATCTLVLTTSFFKIKPEREGVWKVTKAQEAISAKRQDVWSFLRSDCLRRGILKHLDVESQYKELPPGTCCSRCSSSCGIDSAIIGRKGLTSSKDPADEKGSPVKRTHPITRSEVLRALKAWRNDNYDREQVAGRLFRAEMICSDNILERIASKASHITHNNIPIQDIVTWWTMDKYDQPKGTILKIIKDACVAAEPLIEMAKEQEANNKRLANLGLIPGTRRIVHKKIVSKKPAPRGSNDSQASVSGIESATDTEGSSVMRIGALSSLSTNVDLDEDALLAPQDL